ncbi:B-cell CLL/lymphoma 6 member B protein-like [Anopheles albimanus]|nr:B-cell CLL/lymphoma 6 member B protein-like [Anopheles albimanus]
MMEEQQRNPGHACPTERSAISGDHQATAHQSTANENGGDAGLGSALCDRRDELPARCCLMCLLPCDELGSIGSESPEELARIVDNIFKIAKIEVKPQNGKIEPLCGGCRAKLGYDYDEDAYYDMLCRMYSSDMQNKMITIAMNNGHIALPVDRPESPTAQTGPYIDAACGTFVVTELGVEALNAGKDELVCAICSKAFNFKSTLRLHIRSHHQSAPREVVETVRPVRKPRVYECVECQLSFKLKYDYDKHVGTHKKSNMFQCDVCFKLFKHKSYYSMHRNMKRCKLGPVPLDLTGVAAMSDLGMMPQQAQLQPEVRPNGRRNGKTKGGRHATVAVADPLGSVSALLQCAGPEFTSLSDCQLEHGS